MGSSAKAICRCWAACFNSAVRVSISAAKRSAGRSVSGSAPLRTLACKAASKGAGVAPYSPFSTPADSLVMDL